MGTEGDNNRSREKPLADLEGGIGLTLYPQQIPLCEEFRRCGFSDQPLKTLYPQRFFPAHTTIFFKPHNDFFDTTFHLKSTIYYVFTFHPATKSQVRKKDLLEGTVSDLLQSPFQVSRRGLLQSQTDFIRVHCQIYSKLHSK